MAGDDGPQRRGVCEARLGDGCARRSAAEYLRLNPAKRLSGRTTWPCCHHSGADGSICTEPAQTTKRAGKASGCGGGHWHTIRNTPFQAADRQTCLTHESVTGTRPGQLVPLLTARAIDCGGLSDTRRRAPQMFLVKSRGVDDDEYQRNDDRLLSTVTSLREPYSFARPGPDRSAAGLGEREDAVL